MTMFDRDLQRHHAAGLTGQPPDGPPGGAATPPGEEPPEAPAGATPARTAAATPGTGGAGKRDEPAEAPSTPATPPTEPWLVVGDEPAEGRTSKSVYDWYKDRALDHNFRGVGATLRSLVPDLYGHPDGGLVLVEASRPRRIRSGKDLSPLLIDTVHIRVWTEGGRRAERLGQAVLGDMLRSRSFLDNFPVARDVVTTPVVLLDWTPSRPGFNPGGVLHLGPAAAVGRGLETTNRLLDVLEFDGGASRTNAVAAALTVLFPHHWCGAKPLVLVTGTKSHSGKGTVGMFIAGGCARVDILYQNRDWPMEQSLQRQLTERPETRVIVFDNVRLGSSGGGREIRTGLFESLITSSELILSAAKLSSTFRSPNRYVVLLNTNEGVLSADLLNRSLHIGLCPTGDMDERLARARARLGGDVKTEWLPANQARIQAELWGMVDRWVKEGKPLDDTVRYPMAPWARTIGGILAVNGFDQFLGNYQATRAAADRVREAIGHLAFYATHEARQKGQRALATMDLARLVVEKGLGRDLLPRADASNPSACEREIGRCLTPYDGETFTASTAAETVTYKLHKRADRWEGKHVSCRYLFEEVERGPASNRGGVVLEESDNPE
jgi:hypothetical protein